MWYTNAQGPRDLTRLARRGDQVLPSVDVDRQARPRWPLPPMERSRFAEPTVVSVTRLTDGRSRGTRSARPHRWALSNVGPFGVAASTRRARCGPPAERQQPRAHPRWRRDDGVRRADPPKRLGDVASTGAVPSGCWRPARTRSRGSSGAASKSSRFLPPVAGLTALAVAPDGAAWFTELRAHKLGRVRDGVITEFTLPPRRRTSVRHHGRTRATTSGTRTSADGLAGSLPIAPAAGRRGGHANIGGLHPRVAGPIERAVVCLHRRRAAIAVLSCWSGFSRRRRGAAVRVRPCHGRVRRCGVLRRSRGAVHGHLPKRSCRAAISPPSAAHPGGVRADAHAGGHPALDLQRGGKAGVGRRARVAGAVLHDDPLQRREFALPGIPSSTLWPMRAPSCCSSSRRTTQPLPADSWVQVEGVLLE